MRRHGDFDCLAVGVEVVPHDLQCSRSGFDLQALGHRSKLGRHQGHAGAVQGREPGPGRRDRRPSRRHVRPDEPALPQITEAKVRALAVTSKVRLPQLKDVPTLAETVLPGFEASTWYGIYAPKGTPKAALDKVEQAYLKVMTDKAFTGKMTEQAIQMLPTEQYTGAALGKHTEAEVLRWKAVAARTSISLD